MPGGTQRPPTFLTVAPAPTSFSSYCSALVHLSYQQTAFVSTTPARRLTTLAPVGSLVPFHPPLGRLLAAVSLVPPTGVGASTEKDSLAWLGPPPGALYMPPANGRSNPRGARSSEQGGLRHVSPVTHVSERLYPGPGRCGPGAGTTTLPRATGAEGEGSVGPIWKPSGRDPIPDVAPVPLKSGYKPRAREGTDSDGVSTYKLRYLRS